MTDYKCKHCEKVMTENCDKKWIKSFCRIAGKEVHLMKIKRIKCQFCGEPATKMRFKAGKSYPMAYDLCDKCATSHQKVWTDWGFK